MTNLIEIVNSSITKSIEVKQNLFNISELILKAGELCASALKNNNKIMLAGNGGSAADAQHIAAELVVRFKGGNERKALAAMSLSPDSSTITGCGNDYGFENLFSRQIEAFGKKGDVFIAISTSGNSENIIRALAACKELEVTTILLTGADGGKMHATSNLEINVPTKETARIQESHILIGHTICAIIEKKLFNLS